MSSFVSVEVSLSLIILQKNIDSQGQLRTWKTTMSTATFHRIGGFLQIAKVGCFYVAWYTGKIRKTHLFALDTGMGRTEKVRGKKKRLEFRRRGMTTERNEQ